MTTEDDVGKPTPEQHAELIARGVCNARRDYWWMAPLCPPETLDALDAFRQLHRELQEWVAGKGRSDARNVRLWDANESMRKGHVYKERPPLAQIAWLTGPKDWPAMLLMGRSYGGSKTFLHQGRRHYLDPADEYVLSMMPLE